MKKFFVFLIFIICLVVYCPDVKAKEFNSSELGNSSYIIGEHLFTRKVSGDYKGQLTTQYIMLSAMTIKGSDLNDMIIYYKSPKGEWYDALNGSKISPPAKFNINYIDGVSIDEDFTLKYDPKNFVVYSPDSISSPIYVIGTHMFTRNSNENYSGQLTTQYIMLAAKTIHRNNLNDMVIYYKNPRGMWYDALTGKTIDISDDFKIEYVDTVNITNSSIDINECTTSLSSDSFVYDGMVKNPLVDVFYNEIMLEEGIDYYLSYENNINAGVATVIVNGIGNFSNSKKINYNINPQLLKIPTSNYCNSLIYNGYSQKLTKDAPNNIQFRNITGINAGSYDVSVSLDDKTNYQWDDGTIVDKIFSCNIEKKELIVTANNQEINYNDRILTSVNNVSLLGNITNHFLADIRLLQNTVLPTINGKIIPSAAIIKDNNGSDVSSNYNIVYKDGNLIINPPVEEVVNSFDEYQDTIELEDLSSFGIHNPNLSSVSTEVEDKGMLVRFDDDNVGGFAWAQRYLFTSNIKDKFAMYGDFINDEYYIRIWIAEENLKRFGMALYLYNEDNEFYIDPNEIILKNIYGKEVSGENDYSNNYDFYKNTHVLLPEKFHGWVNFPLSAIKNSSGKKIDLTNVSKVILDIRPEEPRAATLYTLDNFTISKNTVSSSYDNTYEINYRTDLVAIKYNNWYDFWQSEAGNGVGEKNIYNVTEILKDTGGNWSDLPQNKFYYWAEPALGYYKSSDEGIIRKHMEQLNDAKIDFIFIDLTNLGPKGLAPYDNEQMERYYEQWIWPYQVSIPTTQILNTMNDMKKEGYNVPHIVFWAGSFNKFGTYDDEGNQYVINRLYDEYISKAEYKDLFVYYDDKPLVIGTNNIGNNIEKNITYRYMWALQDSVDDVKAGEWTNRVLPGSGIYGKNPDGKMEEMPINVAYSAYYMSLGAQSGSEDGRYYHPGNNIPVVIGREGGRTFYTSWQQAFNVHPKILMISSWNEWGAQRLTDNNAPCKDKCFTDQYNMDYSEDIEPMKDGFGDQYYRWMMEYIKEYKNRNSCPTTLLE